MAAVLPGLSTREAIADVLHRAVLAFDTADRPLLISALMPDVVFNIDGAVMDGIDQVLSQGYDKVSKLDTSHIVSNVRINAVDGESLASMTASVLSQHYRLGTGKVPGAEYFMAGSLYFIDAVKDETDGLWKIKNWTVKITWTIGNHQVIE
ncbi:hypothetical protein ASPVEDRAFT_202708 [Aspergillus versicolor CBS 583.65]|uniref:SnoaL-like domain-containing protein n=1 Tax=Aspergillus versicolor CBS 583.65 TaxID=1036611 RepID=A0A1L9Q1P7_ASPVE|nr:uncharacterized protein ASPVEDRAFT_202708 [Aspergillus versicolor CBS 583.65]OJJ07705.1 hypothetical protein ASPVEDRAFT_202708 [Aspergillus versicolor CBS 583.65]